MLVQIQTLGRQIGARWLFQGASLSVRMGDRIGLVGPNGAGKSTLLRVISGDESPDAGQVSLAKGTRLGMLRQEIDPRLPHSVHEEAATALEELDKLEQEMRELEHAMTEAGERGEHISSAMAERYDHISHAFHHGGGFERESEVARVLSGLGFDDEARRRPVRTFSGGWIMRVELAKLFLAQPDVLLLDEPTNHLDLPAIQWFEETIADFPGALIVVSHDRTFLRRHVSRVVDLDGHGRCTVYESGYDRYLVDRDERRAQLLAQKANQDREIAQMERFVERFRAKSTKAKQAQSRVKALERIERIEIEPDHRRRMRMKIPSPPRSGQQVITLAKLCKSYGDNKVYDGIEFSLRRGERVALAGPNGSGKSTLLRIIAGVLDHDSGEHIVGHNVQVAFFAQHQLESLDERLSVLEELASDAATDDIQRLRGHLGAFLFSGDDVDKKISVLSGGEKSRVALAKMLLRPANLLVLDEPTNHLDIQSCEVLERALQSFEGTMVFVSHDRAFINAIASRVVDVQHGVLRDYIGNYDDYLYRMKQLESQAVTQAASTRVSAAASSEPSRAGRTAEAGSGEDISASGAGPGARAHRRDSASGTGSVPSDSRQAATAPARNLSKAERQRERGRRKSRDRVAKQIAKIEQEIQTSEAALEALGWRLADPGVYSDPVRLQEIQAQQADIKATIDTHYATWERCSDELAALDDAAH